MRMDALSNGVDGSASWVILLYTALGVGIIWTSWGAGSLSVKYLSEQLAAVGVRRNWLLVVEFGLTMFVGVLIAVTFVQPQTPQQAIAAGMGWTSLVTRPSDNRGTDSDDEIL